MLKMPTTVYSLLDTSRSSSILSHGYIIQQLQPPPNGKYTVYSLAKPALTTWFQHRYEVLNMPSPSPTGKGKLDKSEEMRKIESKL